MHTDLRRITLGRHYLMGVAACFAGQGPNGESDADAFPFPEKPHHECRSPNHPEQERYDSYFIGNALAYASLAA